MAITVRKTSDEVVFSDQYLNANTSHLPTITPNQMPYAGQIVGCHAYSQVGPVGAAEILIGQVNGADSATVISTLPDGANVSASATTGLSVTFAANDLFTTNLSGANAATPATNPGMNYIVTFDQGAVAVPS